MVACSNTISLFFKQPVDKFRNALWWHRTRHDHHANPHRLYRNSPSQLAGAGDRILVFAVVDVGAFPQSALADAIRAQASDQT